MSYYRVWHYWLIVVSIFIVIFGAVMSLLNTTVIFGFFNAQINPAFWGSSPVPSPALAFQAWVYGAWGATVLGWGITMLFVAWFAFGQKLQWAWYCVLVSVILWYVLDTGISFWFNVMVNVVLNTTILVLVIIPLIFTWSTIRTAQ